MNIKKGDTVIVITGKDKTKSGKVLEVYPKTDRVLVDGVNIVSRHTKPKSAQDKGGIVKKSAPLHVSNVMILDENGKPTRIAHKIVDGKKVRIAKTTGSSLDKAYKRAVKKEAKKAVKEEVKEKTTTTAKVEKQPKTTKTASAAPVKKTAKAVSKKTTTVRKTVGGTGK